MDSLNLIVRLYFIIVKYSEIPCEIIVNNLLKFEILCITLEKQERKRNINTIA